LAHQNGSFVKILSRVFPDVNFDSTKFAVLSSKFFFFWHEVKNRRKFFDSFAREQGFDPLIAENWYSADTAAIRRLKVIFVLILLVKLLINIIEGAINSQLL
jgi:hypothetical protein